MKNKKAKPGLTFKRYFTKEGVNPFDQFTYEKRSSRIRNTAGDAVFAMDDVEVPSHWSQVATDIIAQKYFRKTDVPLPAGGTGSETSARQVVHRLAACWKDWGMKYGYFASKKDAEVFYEEIIYMLLGQYAAPNSPQWFNTGLYNSYNIKGSGTGHWYVEPESGEPKETTSSFEHPQPHACFILSVSDDLLNPGGIMDLLMREAKVFKYGSGSGTNFSAIRGEGEKLGGGGSSSGLMSFLRIGDRAAGAIKSGGTTRRAAKMVCVDIDHPEIEAFINWKAEEEKKVAALINAGYSSHYEGEAYNTVSGQNSNNSVRIPDSFFTALEKDSDWNLVARTDGSVLKKVPAKKLWNELSYAAWRCADPGVQFDTTINEWHTCPEGGRINASNPCSEYMFLDNTACNLASLNLRKFFNADSCVFDVEAFEYACRLWTVVLDISVLMAQFPSKEVALLSYKYRTLGLGYANLGSVLMISGMPYDSDKGRAVAASISAIMTASAYKTSAEMAMQLSPFEEFENNKEHMLRVIRNHRYAAFNSDEYEGLTVKPKGIDVRNCPDYLAEAACRSWNEALSMGEKYGYRNAQVSVVAPTGTIGLLMDCDTTGVEPDFALVKFKKLSGGGYFKIVNESIPAALKNLGYSEKESAAIIKYIAGSGTFNGAPEINEKTLKEKGFDDQDLIVLNLLAGKAFDISGLFNYINLGAETMKRLGFSEKQYTDPSFNCLAEMGFNRQQVERSNEYICGTSMIEGAPYLKEEHLAVFDCANKCGKGQRFIQPMGHVRMMAAVQPFISGAISKTINLPHESTQEDIENCYMTAWKEGLKAVAVYRDGCKLSQPLTAGGQQSVGIKSGHEMLTADDVLAAAKRIINASTDTVFKRQLSNIVIRKKLPGKRRGFTQKAKIAGHTIFVRTGEYGDGTLGEIFIDMHKEGASFRSLLNCFAIAVSIGLQYGVPLEEFVEKFAFTRFEPSGITQHPNIKNSTSVVDYVFRMLAYEYLNRTDLVQTGGEKEVRQQPQQDLKKALQLAENLQPAVSMTGDAPLCNTCGHITIRSGTCYKCLNCGTSMGCS